MMRLPAECARFLCYGWIITGTAFVLGLHKGSEDLSGAGLMAIGLGVTRNQPSGAFDLVGGSLYLVESTEEIITTRT